MMITFREITPENFEETIKLSVGEKQQTFVAPNVYSIAQASLYPTYNVRAVYFGDDMVGFVMFGLDTDDDRYYLGRLMIDRKFQGKGFGRAATLAVINSLRKAEDCTAVYLSVAPENTNAQKLYEQIGFARTGELNGTEIVMRFDFKTGDNRALTDDN
ncbi:MAG: GNAT family N-acetyltransferase [Pyrinomonadaceae bacterium]|nr:GNAT family N-acetyltransferase [Pyrinomonadaceae bacterium]